LITAPSIPERKRGHLHLEDVFDIPRSLPLANVFSVGDAAIVIGAVLLLHSVCGSRPMRFTPTIPWRHPTAMATEV